MLEGPGFSAVKNLDGIFIFKSILYLLCQLVAEESERRLWRHLFVNRKNVAKCYVGFDPKGSNRLQLVTRAIPDYFW